MPGNPATGPDKLRKDLALQDIEMARFPKKIGFVGGHDIQHPNHLISPTAFFRHILVVFPKGIEVEFPEPFPKPAGEHGLLRRDNIDAALTVYQIPEPAKFDIRHFDIMHPGRISHAPLP
jgi:hypothetical protein